MAGIKDDHLITQFLPVHLAKGVRVWLEHFPSGTILNISTKFADGEDMVGAIFYKGKSPHDPSEPSDDKERRE